MKKYSSIFHLGYNTLDITILKIDDGAFAVQFTANRTYEGRFLFLFVSCSHYYSFKILGMSSCKDLNTYITTFTLYAYSHIIHSIQHILYAYYTHLANHIYSPSL